MDLIKLTGLIISIICILGLTAPILIAKLKK